MRTILSKGKLFVISGPDEKPKRHKELLKDEKTEIFVQSVVSTKPTLADFAVIIEEEIFYSSGIGLKLDVESVIIHLTTSDGKKYDFDISNSTNLEDYMSQILEQIEI